MRHNFEEYVDRRNTDCWKWDAEGTGVKIPMGCADTDFRCPEPVVNAIVNKAKTGVYAYGYLTKSYTNAIQKWYNKRHQVTIDTDWVSFSPGIMVGLKMLLDMATSPGDNVIIQPPVYHSFHTTVEKVGRNVIDNNLILKGGRYYIDFDDLEKKAANPRTKLMIICNPHNPVGRVWDIEELRKISKICKKNNVLIMSDEVHSDIVYEGKKHIPFFSISEEAAQQSVTISAGGKTFNIHGFYSSYVVIPNQELHDRFKVEFEKHHFDFNFFGVEATRAAYEECDYYVDQMVEHLWGNVKYMKSFIEEKMPNVSVIQPEATYLTWIDFRKWGLKHDVLEKFFKDAGVGLGSGVKFGGESEGFMRMNIACPHSTLKTALEAIYSQYQKDIQAR